MSITAFITGAQGFLGSHLARALAARGDRVRCLGRDAARFAELREAGCECFEGDVIRPDTLAEPLRGATHVFHLAGIRRATDRATFLAVNADGTRHVALAARAAGARRLILAGSLAASGPAVGGRPRVESDPFQPAEWYGESKARAEELAFSFAGALEVTSCRPSRIMGPGDVENLPFVRLAERGVVFRLLGPPRRVAMVDVDDVVDQLILQAERPEAVGEAFFCSGGEAPTVDELLAMIREALELRPVRPLPVPPAALMALGAAADLASKALGRKLPLNRKLARQLTAPGWDCSIQKARAHLGFAPRRALRDSVERSVRAYRDAGLLRAAAQHS
jgi:nucleoside-diphosphate-sugar epimerase